MAMRKSPRLKNYDYTRPGGYFVTICTYRRNPIFGKIVDYKMVLNKAGGLAQSVWDALPNRFSNISLDARIIMPNHIHGIIFIEDQNKEGLDDFIGWYKYQTKAQINILLGGKNEAIWQRSFFDHIIRDSESIAKIRDYVLGNPARWAEDSYNRIP